MRIALYKESGFVGNAVIFFSRGGYSHAATLFDDGTTIEARPFKMVRHCSSVTLGLDVDAKIDIFNVKTTKKQDKIIRTFLEKQIGKKYDYLGVVGFVVYSTEKGRKEYARWFCSELVVAAFRKAGIDLLDAKAWEISPTILSYNTIMKFDSSIDFKI